MIPRYSRPEMAAIWTDEAKYRRWLDVEIAACEAWAELGQIPREAAEKIRRDAKFDVAKINEYLAITHHDVTAFLRSVADSLGEEGRYVHFGLTSSDVWDTATALQLRDASDILLADIDALLAVLERQARAHRDTLCVGRTHGVHAEPTTFGLKLAVWVDEMRRNRARLVAAREAVAVGAISGTVGTHASVPPKVEELVCAKLGLGIEAASTQVIQRDRHAQFVTTLAIIGASLEKFATEIRALQKTEVREAEEPFDEGQTGSSAMPHKRNPELCERITGLARVLRGYAVTAMENVALWHERDISHSSTERIVFPDATLVLDYMLNLFTGIMDRLRVYPEHMRENLERSYGLVFSQRVLLALIETGLSRQDAYAIVQRNAMRAWNERVPFLDLLLADPEVTSRISEAELRGLFDYGYYLKNIGATFERLGL
ncbi:MAG: adenylosuccinate lyase [Tepidiforma sp.]|uniref:Adenylosuccinate lyase n=1 Tax=Tepidiforma bonchosmolovskayae TaxID=2601677 RepID=A0ABX6C3P4_9CHLR|nr:MULTISPECIES: adenylosuccinate lyase [Tepidiforma]QFG03883.1 adenylosuccinate lyase [Tepidiforma bonchosmolovskayae]GIW15162.1 MAG: adenylosuccinate lyase [Tepidiforma sp.]